MAKPDKKKDVKKVSTPKLPPRPNIVFKLKNIILFVIGIAIIALGFLSLGKGSTVLAPILLVTGYVILIPLSIIIR